MRYLLLFALFAGLAWWLRAHHGKAPRGTKTKSSALPQAVSMQVCRHCGVHVPQHEAVTGKLGSYCGPSHRQLAGD